LNFFLFFIFNFVFQVGLNQEGGIDVYNFLHMMNSTANGEESNTACLGAEIDDIMLEDEYEDWAPSPEHNSSSDKPFFEDSAEFESSLDNRPGESTLDADASNPWGGKAGDVDPANPWEKAGGVDAANPWGKKAGENTSSGWGTHNAESGNVSTKASEDSSRSSGWGAATKNVSSGWGTGGEELRDSFVSTKAQENSSRSPTWDAASPWQKKAGDVAKSGSCRYDGKPVLEQTTETCDSDKKVTQETVQSTSGWVSSTIEDWTRNETPSPSLEHAESPAINHSQGQRKSPESSQGWGASNESNQPASLHGWDSPNAGDSERDRHHQWGRQSAEPSKKNFFEGSRGWGSNDGERKSIRPAKSPGRTHADSSAGGIYTATRQRLDMFTSEEQDVLLDVEQIMQSIRRIMHQPGYVIYDIYIYI
jgi:DNA-directed RNA polymerase-5 subunit 1